MRTVLLIFLLAPLPMFGQSDESLPQAPLSSPRVFDTAMLGQTSPAPQTGAGRGQQPPLLDPGNPGTPITRSEAETLGSKKQSTYHGQYSARTRRRPDYPTNPVERVAPDLWGGHRRKS